MLKVAKLSQEPEKSLIPPSEEVNADDSANKSPSRTSVQPVTQPKAPTAKRLRKKKRSSLTQPEVSKSSRILESFSSQATHLQPAKDFVVIADTTKGLYASESAEVQGNQPKAAEAKKVLDPIVEEVKDAGLESMRDVTFEQIMDACDQQQKAAQEKDESPYDIESEIRIIKSYQAATISGSLFIQQEPQRSSSGEHNVINITPKDAEEGD
ncbi:hypothetical protein Tco_1128438, partial [Tanacetum coccineum]